MIVNLFATVTQSKLSTRGIALDKDNLAYIKDNVLKRWKMGKAVWRFCGAFDHVCDGAVK